jgi:hypothetical protein
MTDLTASKPKEHSTDEADVDKESVTDGERAFESAAKAAEIKLVLTLQRFLRDQGEA